MTTGNTPPALPAAPSDYALFQEAVVNFVHPSYRGEVGWLRSGQSYDVYVLDIRVGPHAVAYWKQFAIPTGSEVKFPSGSWFGSNGYVTSY